MKSITLGLTYMLLTACATLTPYSATPETSRETAVKIIEQVIMEQPVKFRPDSAIINDDFLGLDFGMTSKSKKSGVGITPNNNLAIGFGKSTTTTRFSGERLYFSSMTGFSIYTKRNYYIIQILGSDNRITKRIYTDTELKAHRFVDAMYYFTENSSDIFKKR